MKLNQKSATPLYLQVCNFILSEIKNGKYKEGDKIPSELELCKQFELSRTTIRSAIAALTSQDILVRRQGKGTFVRKQKPFLSLPKKEDSESSPSFSSGGFVLESGVKLTSRISLKTFVPATKNDIMMLGLSPEDQVFLYIISYFVNGKPAAMEEYFLHPKYASLAEQDLENNSIWELLEKHFPFTKPSAPKRQLRSRVPARKRPLRFMSAKESPCFCCGKSSQKWTARRFCASKNIFWAILINMSYESIQQKRRAFALLFIFAPHLLGSTYGAQIRQPCSYCIRSRDATPPIFFTAS